MLDEDLYDLDFFQTEYEKVFKYSVSKSLHCLKESCQDFNEIGVDWNKLLEIASVLAQSDKEKCLDAALRIAQTVIANSTCETQKKASAYILEILTNKPSIKLAIKRGFIDEEVLNEIGIGLQLHKAKIDYTNSVQINDKSISLNKFQKKVYDACKEYQIVSISAPTSAGKSYILSQILIEELLKFEKSTIIYVVPTRALISQVEAHLKDSFKENKIENIEVSSVPQ